MKGTLSARRITHNVAGPPATCGDGQQNPRGSVTGIWEDRAPEASASERGAPQYSPLKMAPHSPRHCTFTMIDGILVVGPSARRISGEVLNFGNTRNQKPRAARATRGSGTLSARWRAQGCRVQ
jgi:hypothetical protein